MPAGAHRGPAFRGESRDLGGARVFGGQVLLLRQAYRGILPDHILDRRNKGFGAPRYYMKDVGGRFIQEHILRSLFLGATVES